MLRGLYISGVGMQAQINRMDVLSNNLANVNTTGFKRDATASRSFTDELMRRVHGETPNPITGHMLHSRPIGLFTSGVFVDEVFTDFSQGSLMEAGDPFALALAGPGFFTVEVELPTGEVVTRFTRDGDFTIDFQGFLRTKDGARVLATIQDPDGEEGEMLENIPVFLPHGDGFSPRDAIFERDGRIIMNGEEIGTLMLAFFDDLTSLRKTGNNLFTVDPLTDTAPISLPVARALAAELELVPPAEWTELDRRIVEFARRTEIVQGYLENSNANAVREMIELINVSRIYEANSRFVQTMDQILQQSANEVARR